jgi:hypothetical protein
MIQTAFEHQGTVYWVRNDRPFPTMIYLDGCDCGYRVDHETKGDHCSCSFSTSFSFLISIRQAYVDAFLSDPVDLTRKDEAVVYLTTPHGTLPIYIKLNDTASHDAFKQLVVRVGDTKIMAEGKMLITYETGEKRDKAFQDITDQLDRVWNGLKSADRDVLLKKQQSEWAEFHAKHLGNGSMDRNSHI